MVWNCAYCGPTDTKRTREHLFPASLHKRMLELGSDSDSRFWLRKIDREIVGEPTIKDVCAQCNNGPLSELDAYAVQMFDQYCTRILDKGEIVEFTFDYHRLKRWLLKMSYNSARLHGSKDLHAYVALLPYIRDGDVNVGRSVDMFLQLSFPGEVSQADRNTYLEGGDEPKIWPPRLNRVGLAWLTLKGKNKLVRIVHLQSFVFYLAFVAPGSGAASAQPFGDALVMHSPGTMRLRASQPKVTIACEGLDAWWAFKGSRQNELV